MYLVRLQRENEKQKNPRMIQKQGGEPLGAGSLKEGMLFVVLLKDSSLYCKIRRWAAFKKKS